MDNEAQLIEKVRDILDDADPDVALRAIDYLATTYRAELKEHRQRLREQQERQAVALGTDTAAKKPSFLHTQHRIEVGEVLLELERRGGAKKR